MIVVTGADGFIGSNVRIALNNQGDSDLCCVDFTLNRYCQHIKMMSSCSPPQLPWVLAMLDAPPLAIVHLGAVTNTNTQNTVGLHLNNIWYPTMLWQYCRAMSIPFIYASSAGTYGDGAKGFDDEAPLDRLRPLSPYAMSKHRFDMWASTQSKSPPAWYGLKFFNVYGPNEGHKGGQASMAHQALDQIRETGHVRLFSGSFKRDFIHVSDVAKVVIHMIESNPKSGIYNVGTGKASDFREVASCAFKALRAKESIKTIRMPKELRSQYQAHTQATTKKLAASGFGDKFVPLGKGIASLAKTKV